VHAIVIAEEHLIVTKAVGGSAVGDLPLGEPQREACWKTVS
jgi:hypothetical protein